MTGTHRREKTLGDQSQKETPDAPLEPIPPIGQATEEKKYPNLIEVQEHTGNPKPSPYEKVHKEENITEGSQSEKEVPEKQHTQFLSYRRGNPKITQMNPPPRNITRTRQIHKGIKA